MTRQRATTSGWGPQQRRAAVSVTFETLTAEPGLTEAAPEGDARVSPALPTLLQLLAERRLPATFFAGADVARAEPLALTMIAAGRNEIGALVDDAEDLQPALAALRAAAPEVRGLRARSAGAVPAPGELAAAALRYASAPGDSLDVDGGVVRLPLDRRLSDAAFLAPALVGGDPAAQRHPGSWHEALQIAIGRALEHGTHATVTFFPGLLERADALAVLVETLDLLAGLRRAARLWVPTLDELAAWWLQQGASR